MKRHRSSQATESHISARILGGGLDVGRSSILLKLGHRHVLLDCGAHPGFSDPTRRFPDLSLLPPRLDAILVSHFHLDHAGALPLLRDRILRDKTPLFMTRPTRDLTRLMLYDFHDTSVARRQTIPFNRRQIDDVLNAVHPILDDQEKSHIITDTREDRNRPGSLDKQLPQLLASWHPEHAHDVEISAWYAGHVLGAVMFRVAVDGVGSVVYTGDYSTSPDRLLRAAETPALPSRPNLLITEATYCTTVRRTSKSAFESQVLDAVREAIRTRAKVLIPVAALGGAHEVIAMLTPLWRREGLEHVPIHVAVGLMNKANAIYNSHIRRWGVEDANPVVYSTQETEDAVLVRKDLLNRDRTTGVDAESGFFARPMVREFRRGRDWHLVTGEGPLILIATPASMSAGVSLDAFEQWRRDARNLVIVPGFCFANTRAARLLQGGRDLRSPAAEGDCKGTGEEVKCRFVNMSVHAHADARGVLRTIRRLDARAVMLVHGDGSKIRAFARQLVELLDEGVSVFCPGNGELVEISEEDGVCYIPKEKELDERRKKRPVGDPLNMIRDADWREIAVKYRQAMAGMPDEVARKGVSQPFLSTAMELTRLPRFSKPISDQETIESHTKVPAAADEP